MKKPPPLFVLLFLSVLLPSCSLFGGGSDNEEDILQARARSIVLFNDTNTTFCQPDVNHNIIFVLTYNWYFKDGTTGEQGSREIRVQTDINPGRRTFLTGQFIDRQPITIEAYNNSELLDTISKTLFFIEEDEFSSLIIRYCTEVEAFLETD